jgi:hypothetical protein
MPLQKQKFNISFLGGVDTKTDDKQVVPGKLLALENGILTKIGKVIKRNGYGVLGNTLSGGAALTNYQDELLAYDGTQSWSYSESTNSWVNRGDLNCLSIESKPIIRNTYQQTNGDSVIHPNGLEMYTWTDGRGGSRYSFVDSTTGQIIIPDEAFPASYTKVKPIALGAYILVFFFDTGTNTLRARPYPAINPGSPLAAIDVSISMNVSNPNYDVCVIGDRIFIAFNASTSRVGLVYLNAFLQLATPVYATSENANTAISVCGDAVLQQATVAYYNGTAVKYFVKSYTLGAVLGATAIETVANIKNITAVMNNGAGKVFHTQTAAATYNNLIRQASVTNAGAVTNIGVFVRSLSLCSKAFLYNSIPYVATVFDTALQPTIFVLNTDAVAVAKVCFQLAGGTVVNNMLANVNTIDGVNYLFAYTKKDLLDAVSGTVYTQTGINSTVLTFTSDNSFQEAQLGNNLHVTGGIVQMYDGISFVEHDFNYFPENITNSINTGAGSINAGTRQYVVTYEWLDNQGQVHRCTTSVPVTVVNVGATNTNTLTIPTLRLTEKKSPRSNVQIVVYRTVSLGSIFYQITSTTSPLYNDTSVDSVTYADAASDASIIGNNLLYTTGGVVDNAQAEATNLMTNVRGRLFYVPAENPFSYNYSKLVTQNAPVEFYDQQPTQIDRRGGKITAIAPLDDKIIFFKKSAIFYLIGEGPDASGAQNDYNEAQLITTDGGCIDPSSVVSMPLGLMYKSEKGIYVLNRGLNIEYIGKEVEVYNSDTIVAATLVSNKNQVRFALNTGIVLVYDYLVGQWYTFTNHNLLVDSTNYKDTFVYLRSDGQVWQENNSFSDNGNYIKMKIVTSWFSLAQFEGFQRIYKAMIIGNYVSKHKLIMSVAYDFNPYTLSSVVIDAYTLLDTANYGDTSPYGAETVYGGNFPLYQFRYQVPRQKCESIQMTFEDVQTDEVGEAYQLSGLAFEVGIKQGLDKLGATRTFS